MNTYLVFYRRRGEELYHRRYIEAETPRQALQKIIEDETVDEAWLARKMHFYIRQVR
jgi:hypothetical protein